MNLNEVSTVDEEYAYRVGFYAIPYVSSAFSKVSAWHQFTPFQKIQIVYESLHVRPGENWIHHEILFVWIFPPADGSDHPM